MVIILFLPKLFTFHVSLFTIKSYPRWNGHCPSLACPS